MAQYRTQANLNAVRGWWVYFGNTKYTSTDKGEHCSCVCCRNFTVCDNGTIHIRLEEVTWKQPWQGWVCLLTFVSWGKHKASLSCSITRTVSYLCCGVTVGVNVETVYSIFSTKQLFDTHFSPSRKSGNWSQGLWLWSHTVAFIGVAVSLWRRNHSLETLAY